MQLFQLCTDLETSLLGETSASDSLARGMTTTS